MLELFRNMFAGKGAAEKVIDNVSNGIDKLWYTEEEKAEDRAQAKREGTAVYMEWLRSTSGSRLSRRFIAIVVTLIWAFQYLSMRCIGAIIPWIETPETVDALTKTLEFLSNNSEEGTSAFMIVLGFYFLANKADKLWDKAIEGFSNAVGKRK